MIPRQPLGFGIYFVGIVGRGQRAAVIGGSHHLAISTSGMEGKQVATVEQREGEVGGKDIATLADGTYDIIVQIRI